MVSIMLTHHKHKKNYLFSPVVILKLPTLTNLFVKKKFSFSYQIKINLACRQVQSILKQTFKSVYAGKNQITWLHKVRSNSTNYNYYDYPLPTYLKYYFLVYDIVCSPMVYLKEPTNGGKCTLHERPMD